MPTSGFLVCLQGWWVKGMQGNKEAGAGVLIGACLASQAMVYKF